MPIAGMENRNLFVTREKQKIEQRAALIVKNKELHFTDHAKQRMDARGISTWGNRAGN